MSPAALSRLEIDHKTNGLRYVFSSLSLEVFSPLLDVSSVTFPPVRQVTCPKNELLFYLRNL